MPRVTRWKTKNHIKANVFMYAVLYDMELIDVAKTIKMPPTTLYQQLGNPNNIRLGTLKKLCQLFECKIEDLIYPKMDSVK